MTLVMKCRGRRDASNGILHKSTIHGRHIHFWGKLPIFMSFEQTPAKIFQSPAARRKEGNFREKSCNHNSREDARGHERWGKHIFPTHTFFNFFTFVKRPLTKSHRRCERC